MFFCTYIELGCAVLTSNYVGYAVHAVVNLYGKGMHVLAIYHHNYL